MRDLAEQVSNILDTILPNYCMKKDSLDNQHGFATFDVEVFDTQYDRVLGQVVIDIESQDVDQTMIYIEEIIDKLDNFKYNNEVSSAIFRLSTLNNIDNIAEKKLIKELRFEYSMYLA